MDDDTWRLRYSWFFGIMYGPFPVGWFILLAFFAISSANKQPCYNEKRPQPAKVFINDLDKSHTPGAKVTFKQPSPSPSPVTVTSPRHSTRVHKSVTAKVRRPKSKPASATKHLENQTYNDLVWTSAVK